MKRLREVILATGLSLLALITIGCINSFPTVNIDSILPDERKRIPYRETKQKATLVANAVEGYFPEGVLIHKESNKYVALEVFKGERKPFFNILNDGRTLRITTYKFKSPIKEIKKYFIREKDKTTIFYKIGATKVLDESDYFFKKIVNDENTDGLRRRDPGDFVRTIIEGRERILTNGNITTNNKIKRKDRLDSQLTDENILYRESLEQFESYSK